MCPYLYNVFICLLYVFYIMCLYIMKIIKQSINSLEMVKV